jgi:hypothetical protein
MSTHSAKPTFTAVIELDEDDDHTEARATLDLNGTRFVGTGRADRNPADPSVPIIGEELAAGRALRDLAARMLADADDAIHDVEVHPASQA